MGLTTTSTGGAAKEIGPRKPASIWNTRLNDHALYRRKIAESTSELAQCAVANGSAAEGRRDTRSREMPARELGSRESTSWTGRVEVLRQLGSRASPPLPILLK